MAVFQELLHFSQHCFDNITIKIALGNILSFQNNFLAMLLILAI